MRCDYLKATFWGEHIFHDGEIKDLFGVRLLQLREALGGDWIIDPKSRNSYLHHWYLERDGERICEAYTCGTGDAEGSHQIESVGHHAAEVRRVMNEVFNGEYATARRDTCFDFIDDDSHTMFNQLAEIGRQMCREGFMSYDQIGKGWLVPGQTKTIYLGSRKSTAFMRIYTRGLKTLLEGGSDDINRIRVEIEIKPNKKATKESLTTLTDHQLFGCSKWSKEFMDRAGITGIERFRVGSIWKPSDQDKAIHHMMVQYGGLLRTLLEKNGAEGLANIITTRHEANEEIKQAMKRVKSAQLIETVEGW